MWLLLALILISYSVVIFTFVHMIAISNTVTTKVIVTSSSEAHQAAYISIFGYVIPNCIINGQPRSKSLSKSEQLKS